MSLTRISLRAQIKEILLRRILNREYHPGDRLVELQIAQEFGTSQAPVREALRELEALGFVESEPYRGTRVRDVKQHELIEIYPVRAALEEVAAREAATKMKGDVRALEMQIQAMHRAAEARNINQQVLHDVEFHKVIIEACGNSVLQEVWRSLRIEARTLISVVTTEVDLKELAEMHRPVMEAIAEQDREKAGRLMRSHVEHFGTLLIRKGELHDSPG